MIKSLALVLALALLSTTASARQRTWSSPPSAAGCDLVARTYAQYHSAEGLLIGTTAVGSLAGLGIGAIWAASGVGAAVGAAVGAVVGIAIREERYGHIYVAAYSDCMSGRRIS
jgi:hypothetical protein